MRHTYIFIGLTPTERALLESLFALDDAEALVPVRRREDAHLIIANGDDRTVVDSLRHGNPHALIVLVGQPQGEEIGLPVLRRPLEMLAVAEVLSHLDWPAELQRHEPPPFDGTFLPSSIPSTSQAAKPAPSGTPDPSAFALTTASVPISVDTVHTMGAPTIITQPAPPPPVSARATWAVSEQGTLENAQLNGFADEQADADILVVTGTLGQRSLTLPRGMRRMGFRVRLLNGAEATLAAFAQHPARFVFLDHASLGDGTLSLARTLIAQQPMPGHPPHIVVLARGGSAFDRLRARMAGCACMTAPIDRERLLAFFARRGLYPDAAPAL